MRKLKWPSSHFNFYLWSCVEHALKYIGKKNEGYSRLPSISKLFLRLIVCLIYRSTMRQLKERGMNTADVPNLHTSISHLPTRKIKTKTKTQRVPSFLLQLQLPAYSPKNLLHRIVTYQAPPTSSADQIFPAYGHSGY